MGWLKSRVIYDYNPLVKIRINSFYKQFVKKGDLCFDVGAHTGNRTSSWLKLGATVVAIEPQKYFSDFLKKRFKNKQVYVERKGVGVKEEELVLSASSLYPTISSFSKEWKDLVAEKISGKVYDKVEKVQITTLDILIQKYGIPEFCKIDVEGFEVEVLKGLSTPIKCLSFEFYNEQFDRAKSGVELMDSLAAYEYNWSTGEKLKLMTTQWLNGQELFSLIEREKGSFSGDIYARIKSAK